MERQAQSGTRRSVGILALALVCVSLHAQPSADSTSDTRLPEYEQLLKQAFELHKRAQFAEAIPLLERARRLAPQDYDVNLLLGIDLLRSGKAADAIPHLEDAAHLETREDTPEGYLGEAQATLGHYAQAEEAYRLALVRSHGSDEAIEASAGFAVERFRQIGESLRASTAGVATVRRLEAAARKPDFALICNEPLPVLERRFALRSAKTGVSDSYLDTAYKLSVCYAVEAGRAAERLEAGTPDEAAYHRLRGDILLRVKTDAPAAEVEYRKALDLRPNDPALLARLAEAQVPAGDMAGARQSAQAALQIDSQSREALRTLAFVAMSDREYDQALPWLQRLIAESPGDLSARVECARALAETGDNVSALNYLGPALAAGYPDEKGALHALEARILRAMGRKDDAARASADARRLSDAFQAQSKDDRTGNGNQ